MSSSFQTIAALIIVAVSLAWLVWRALAKRKGGGCGSDCGAISPDIKRLQAKLRKAGKP